MGIRKRLRGLAEWFDVFSMLPEETVADMMRKRRPTRRVFLDSDGNQVGTEAIERNDAE